MYVFHQFDTLSPLNSEKTIALDQEFERVNTIFAGSSHIYRQFDPALFDSVMNANDISTVSLNLGMDGMRALESHLTMEWILEMRPPNLKLVILELQQILPIHPSIQSTRRVTHYHNFTRTLSACRVFWENERHGLSWKITELSTRLMLFTKHITLFGRGIELLETRMNYSAEMIHDKHVSNPTFTGFQPLDDDLAELRPGKRRRYHIAREVLFSPKGQDILRTDIKLLLREKEHKREAKRNEQANAAFWLGLVQQYQTEGIRFIFVVSPGSPIGLKYSAEEIRQNNIDVNVIELNSPSRFPELYQVDHLSDNRHLNDKGAELATRILAQEIQRLPVLKLLTH